MVKRFFLLLLCLAAALTVFTAAAETPQNVDAEVNKYIFYVNDASGSTAVFQSAALEKGQSLSQPENPSPQAYGYDDHYRFAGWYADEALTTLYPDFDQEITDTSSEEPIAIYAKFEKVFHIVYLDDQGHVLLTEEVLPNAEHTFAPDDPLFAPQPVNNIPQVNSGWKDQNGVTYTTETVTVTQDLTMTPDLKPGYYAHFFTEGGSFVPSQFLKPGDKVARPDDDPTRQGYVFDDWYTAATGGERFNFDAAPTSGVDLYAHWTPATAPYTLVFMLQNADDDDYTYHSSYQKTGRTGQGIVLDANDKQYAKLIVQGTNIETCFLSETNPPQLPVINADGSSVAYVYCDRIYYSYKNKENERQVDYIRWGQDLRPVMQQLGYDLSYLDTEKGILLYTPQLGTNLAFNPNDTMPADDGYPNPAGTYRMYNIENFTTLGRSYGKIGMNEQYPLGQVFELEKNDASGKYLYIHIYHRETCDSPNQNGDKAYIEYSYVRTRSWVSYRGALPTDTTTFKFDRVEGVRLLGNNQYVFLVNDGSIPVEFYYDRHKYDIVFIENDDDLGPDANAIQDVFFNKPLDGMAPNDYVENQTKVKKLDGITYLFSGWYTDPAAKMEKVDFSSAKMPDHDLTLYAAWKPVQSTVTFDPNGGELTADASVTLPTGTQVAQPTDPVWADDTHVFLGWTRNGHPYDFASPVDRDFTLVAQWGSTTTYQVTYKPGDGAGDDLIDPNTYLAGSAAVALPFPDTMTPPANQHFIYWHGSDGNDYLPGQTVAVNGNVTLTAVYAPWIKNQYTITYVPAGGTLGGSTADAVSQHVYEDEITIREAPDRAGYRFLGWDDGIQVPYYQPDDHFTVLGHHTFIARWMELTSITGEKIWKDGGKTHDTQNEVALTLYRATAGGMAAVPADEFTLAWEGNKYTYTNLDKTDADGNVYTYTVTEALTDAANAHLGSGETYVSTVDATGFIFTNTLTGTTEVTVVKVWNDENNQDGKRPASIELTISGKYTVNGTEKSVTIADAEVTITPTSEGWPSHAWQNLPKYQEGQLVTYTVTETAIEGYTTAYDPASVSGATGTITITNTHAADTINVTAAKTWDDNDDQDGKRSEERRVGKECLRLCRSRWSPYH